MCYFILYPHCYYKEGVSKGAIFDILRKRTFWLEEKWKCEALAKARQGVSLSQIAKETEHRTEEVEHFARWLAELDFGFLSPCFEASVKYRPFYPPYSQTKNGITLPLGRVMLETASSCPLSCDFCDTKKRLASMECICGRYSDTPKIRYPIAETIARLACMRPQVLELVGGDPLVNRKMVQEILVTAAEHDIPTVVRTGGTLLEKADIQALKETGAGLILQLVNFIPEENKQSHILLNLLRLSQEAGYGNYSFALLYDEEHWEAAWETEHWLSQYGKVEPPVLFYSDAGQAARKGLSAHLSVREPAGYALGPVELARMGQGHFCWQDSLCIMANGEVRRCIADAKHPYGNVLEENLLDIIRKMRHEQIQQLHENVSPVCSGCEFQLGCYGCAVTGEKYHNHSGKQSWNCAYDPAGGRFT